MDLYIEDFGTKLRKKGRIIEIVKADTKFEIAPSKVKSIVLSRGISLTTDVIQLAIENNIDIIIFDKFGQPYGRFWYSKFGSTAYIRRRQLEIFENEKGIEIAKEFLISKIKNCSTHLIELKAKRQNKREYIDEENRKMQKYIYKIKSISGKIDEKRTLLMGYEGNAGRIYYQVLAELIPKEFKFEKRSLHPAKDEFNALLNYAFGILYSKVEKACIIAGLDPYTGILHTDNYGKKSLVFDIIENYRHLATKTVFALFSSKKINKDFFEVLSNGVLIKKEGKSVLVENMYKTLEKKVRYNGRNISNLDKIQFDCHNLANRLIDEEKDSAYDDMVYI